MKLLGITLLLNCVFMSYGVTFFNLVHQEWETYKLLHSKSYDSSVEEKFRMKIYMENKNKIAKHNSLYAQGDVPYGLAMNKYGDLLHHEFVSTMNGFKRNYNDSTVPRHLVATFITPENLDAPKQIDWRAKGAVTDVKDQGQCGSCWAFSTTGALEGQNYRKTGVLTSLSEQNLIDCSTKYGNEGCNGGLMDQAFQYIKDNKGIDTETSYPYEGKDDTCQYDPSSKGASDVGFVDVPSGNEKKLKEAVASVGPVSVAIDASHESFQFYSTGVYSDPQCSSTELDHGVLVVGYGTDHGNDYWLIKNSWGPTWGDKGYVKIARNQNNQCGVATQASYPLV